ncbi:MAG: prenyltransferase/squalene oxidase repeat-containing protein [Catenulispora sp.]
MCAAVDTRVETSISRAAEALFAAQRPDGSFPNVRPTAVLGTAGAVAALHFADHGHSAGYEHSTDHEHSADLIAGGVAWLAKEQNPDGGWGGVPGCPTQVVPTVVAMAVLHLVDPAGQERAVARARERLADLGGVESLSDPGMAYMASTFLALAGLHDLAGSRRIPLGLLMLPRRLWRRRMSFRVAPFIAMAFIQARHTPGGRTGRLARRTALKVLAQIERGENDRGGYGGDNWLAAVVCIGLVCADAPRAMVDAAVGYLRGNVHEDGSWHIMQGLDLVGGGFAARGLALAGYAGDPRLVRARDWRRGCRQREPFPVYGAPAGGWGWEGPRGWPNFLDSATVLSALSRGRAPESDAALRGGLDWLRSRRDSRGSWGTFVPDTTLPNDGPCPYVTAQCVEVLLENGASTQDPHIVRALNWLAARQQPDGTFDALWYRGRIPGTAMVLAAFARAGLADRATARRAAAALLDAQLDDGSWGPSGVPVPGDDPGTGTVEETSWALWALLAGGTPARDERLRRAAEWLLAAQRADGRWPASPVAMHIRNFAYYVDGLIVDGLALRALGSYREAA